MSDSVDNSTQRIADALAALDKSIDTDEEKHIRAVRETEDSYVIEFGKTQEEAGYNDEEEEDEARKEFVEITSDIKAMDEDEDDEQKGTFEGYGSIFNNKDLGNDVVVQGAFAKSLRRTGAKGVKMLYQHKSDMPIGVFESIKEDENGLKVKGRLALGTQAGKEAYELMKMGALDGLSIGFRVAPKGQEYNSRSKRRYIKEVELMEISLVTFPMNPKARVRSVKGDELSIREWEGGLRDAFSLSRSEAKVAAKAVHKAFNQREAEVSNESNAVEALSSLTNKLKHL